MTGIMCKAMPTNKVERAISIILGVIFVFTSIYKISFIHRNMGISKSKQTMNLCMKPYFVKIALLESVLHCRDFFLD